MRSQLTTQVELNSSNVPIVTLIDSYDAVGNRMTRSVNGTVATWTYDDLYRLTGQVKPGQVATYTLDGVGNLKTMWEGGSFPKTFTHDPADKIVTMIEGSNLTTYTHTGYGALASEVTGNATTGYAYSGQDQLVEVTDPSGAKTTYSFDGDGLRRATLYEDQSQDPPLEMRTTFVWDGSDYLLLNGPSSNTVILTLGGEIVSSGSFDLLPDSLGSVIGDIRSGQEPRVPFSYWPYGTMLLSVVQPSFPFLFVGSLGYYYDSAGSDYVRARELMKKNGRWMQVDPYWPDEKTYVYANSNPTSFLDPSGTVPTFGCTEGQRQKIAKALASLQGVGWDTFLECLSTCDANSTKTNLNGGLDDFVSGLLNGSEKYEIHCLSGGWWPFVNRCNDDDNCAFSNPLARPPRLHLCVPMAFNERKCGPLKCIIAHEMIHLWGVMHGNNDSYLNCVKKLAGCENYTPANTHGGAYGK